jgi:hypothetical protein
MLGHFRRDLEQSTRGEVTNMATKLQSCMKGPMEWPTDLTVPDWFTERAVALIGQLGEEHPDSKAFRSILTNGHIDERSVDYVDYIASKTENPESRQLAIDISNHCFTTIKVMTLIPLRMA